MKLPISQDNEYKTNEYETTEKVFFKVIFLQGKMQATFSSIQNANIKLICHE